MDNFIQFNIHIIQNIPLYLTMQNTLSFDQLIRNHQISAQQFFQGTGIANQVRNNLSKFTHYVLTHKLFAQRMIKLAFNISYQQLDNSILKTASYNINQVFSNQQKQIFDLFFQPKNKSLTESGDIPEELDGIQSEAQKLFQIDYEQTRPQDSQRQIQINRQDLFTLTFQILKQKNPNQTCLGHIQKIYSYMIRQDSYQMLQFFTKHTDDLNLFLQNLQYSSISSIMAQLLTSQDKTKAYKYQPLKKYILEASVQQIFMSIQDSNFFEGVMTFVQQIFTSSKQSYYEYFQDFKRVANYLVSKQVLKRFYDDLFKLNSKSFGNTSKFLQLLFARINNDQDQPNYYQQTKSQPTMNFQISVFIQHYSDLLDLIHEIGSFDVLTKISYTSFLNSLTKIQLIQKKPLSLIHPSFIKLLQHYSKQTKSGIYKNNIFSLILQTFTKATKEQLQLFINQYPQVLVSYFPNIKTVSNSNSKNYHRNQNVAFDIGIFTLLTKKDQNLIPKITAAINKDFKKITKKFQTKIANFLTNPGFSQEQQSLFIQTIALNKTTKDTKDTNNLLSLNFVGKNNTPVPLLHLPDKLTQKSQQKEEQDDSQDFFVKKLDLTDSREIVQVQEVVVLTDTLQFNKNQNNQKDMLSILNNQNNFKQTSQSPKKQIPIQNKEQILKKIIVKQTQNIQKICFFNRHIPVYT